MQIKRLLAALIATMLLCCSATCTMAEDTEDDGFFSDYGDFGFGFDDDAYEGEWVEVQALMIEFCLPDGWTPGQAAQGAVYSAEKDDGSASLSIRLAAQDVDDLSAWGKANLKGYQMDEANFYDVLVVEGENALSIYADVSEEGLLAFDFTRTGADALTREFALQIVGSVCAIWGDGDILVDGDFEDFDFGEAFGEDLD